MDWPSIVNEHGPAIIRISARILGSGSEAEDVSQETFVAAYRAWQSGSIENWGGLLRRIATRRAIDFLRQRRESSTLEADPPSRSAAPDEQIAAAELTMAVRTELTLLPQRQAEVFALRYLEDYSNSEIAQALDISASSVSTALTKARTTLARKLAHLRVEM